MELIVITDNNCFKVSSTAPLNNFNYEVFKRLFQMTFKIKNKVNACSSFKNSKEVSEFIDRFFNVVNVLEL